MIHWRFTDHAIVVVGNREGSAVAGDQVARPRAVAAENPRRRKPNQRVLTGDVPAAALALNDVDVGELDPAEAGHGGHHVDHRVPEAVEDASAAVASRRHDAAASSR